MQKGTLPVTLLLKQTSHRPERNAEPAVWLSFIDMCKIDFAEVTFIVVGLREEVSEYGKKLVIHLGFRHFFKLNRLIYFQ